MERNYKKIILILIIFVLSFSVIYISLLIKKKVTKITTVYSIEFSTFRNSFLTNKNILITNNKIIVNFFSPTCEHCQYMATQYLKNKEQLKDITILMVTIADSISVAKFKNDYQLNTLPNIVLLRDTKFQFYKIFGTATVPSFFIYEHQKLVKKIIGETKIENLISEP